MVLIGDTEICRRYSFYVEAFTDRWAIVEKSPEVRFMLELAGARSIPVSIIRRL